jgi:hypothetical protein
MVRQRWWWVYGARQLMGAERRSDMPAGRHGSSIKDSKQYDALRGEGMSKEKAARISNTSAKRGRSAVGRKGGKAGDYDSQTKDELMDKARRVGIEGRSRMSKSELISALRNH